MTAKKATGAKKSASRKRGTAAASDAGAGGRSGNALPPRKAQRISLDDAVALTQRYRRGAPASEHGGFFWADGLRALLDQPGVAGMRYYHGLDADSGYRIVLVAVNGKGQDIVRPAAGKGRRPGGRAPVGDDVVLLEEHQPCPPYCDPDSPLV